MANIKIMNEILANKIAAGEVVEKAASVVKELVENSIDSGANIIKIELKESGIKEIKVTDNGSGMDEEDALLAFSRHATSKIYDEDDLYNILTLGFRGEALASIASVTKVDMLTSKGNLGTKIKIEGGKLISNEKGDARKGTVITIRDLFFNTPARLKHLKSLYTELANITDYINKLALSHPDIKFNLSNDDREILNTDGSGNLLKTISSIFGMKTVKKMYGIKGENEDYIVEGFISYPEVHKSNRNSMITLVNGRVVKNLELNKTINEAYHTYKPDNRYPVVVLSIEVDPSLIDVNIHPTKMDIKFSKIEELKELVKSLILNKLSFQNLIPKIESEMKNEVENETSSYVQESLQLSKPEVHLNFDEPKNLDETEYFINEKLIENNNIEFKEKIPELYVVGLVHGTYIICQNEKGMYLIDQHAAKERVNYEQIKKKMGSLKSNSIDTLIPFTIEFPANEYIVLKENFNTLENLGFEIEEFGINSIRIKSHPSWLPSGFEENTTKKIIEIVLKEEKNFNLERFNDHMSAEISCKMSIKGNTNITPEEIENLIKDLRNCDNPFHCPHGRPVIITYTKEELEKQFKRSGF